MTELPTTLRDWLTTHPEGRLAVALSGGMDSVALLHALAQIPAARQRGLRALHIDHGLHPDSRRWARYCREYATALQLPIQVVRVTVEAQTEGIEAGARHARYTAIAKRLRQREWLLTAQHAEDQAETVLLKLMRGADLSGLAGMRRTRALGLGQLARPLIDLPRAAIHTYALEHGLSWILDPSNTDTRYDRGYLRSEVLPRLIDRWPAAIAAINRSATHLHREWIRVEADAAAMLANCRAHDPRSLDLGVLLALPATMQPRVLLAWLGALGWAAPSTGQLNALLTQLTRAPAAREPSLRWQDYSLRRHHHRLHAVHGVVALPADWSHAWDLRHALVLPDGRCLQIHGKRIPRRTLRACARQGGERIHLPGRGHSTSVKHALQSLDLPPWQRAGLPFLWDGDELLAVGDVLVSASLTDWLKRHGLRIEHSAPQLE